MVDSSAESGYWSSGGQAASATSQSDPSPVSAGFLVGVASLMLLIALVAPGCLLGRREARNGPGPAPPRST